MGHTCTCAWVPMTPVALTMLLHTLESGLLTAIMLRSMRGICSFSFLPRTGEQRSLSSALNRRNRRVENEFAGGRNYKVVNPLDDGWCRENLKIRDAYRVRVYLIRGVIAFARTRK